MLVKIYPSNLTNDQIIIPPSKSMAHRAIICASLAAGTSIISNIDYSIDIKTTIAGMRKLGAIIEESKDSLTITGISNFNNLKEQTIECNESGSTLRFFIPIFSLTNQKVRFTGKNRLLKRPQKLYEDIFTNQKVSYTHNEEYIEVDGAIEGGEFTVLGNVSSQFISGLLFTLPLCEKDSIIKILPPFESKSYIDLTIQMLSYFKITAFFKDDLTIVIPGNQKYVSSDIRVEGDYSQFGFFATLGAINGPLKCLGLKHDSLQGDKNILNIFKDMNIKFDLIDDGYYIHKNEFNGTTMNMENCPDLGPTLTTLATFATTKSTMINANRLRIKESDRIQAMEDELKKLNIDISSTNDEVYINPNNHWYYNDILSGHKDHRIVMALAIGATVSKTPLLIAEAESINKSYPNFFDDLKSLGIKVEIIEE